MSKNLSDKYSQKRLDHTKQSATDALLTLSKRANKKKAETTGDLIRNKIADEITKVSRTSPQNSLETVKNEHDKYLKKDIYLQKKGRKLVIIQD